MALRLSGCVEEAEAGSLQLPHHFSLVSGGF